MQTGREGQVEAGLQAGATLQNRYLIQGVLGVGGMGSVYRARDLRFPNVTKLVAVKEILNLAPDPSIREMIVKTFEREANILATLSHPSIPQIYDYFTQGDRSFLVQEYIEGKDLEAYLIDTPGLLSGETVVDWATQLCEVLSHLHAHKPDPIVFRDMKPSNIMLDQHNRIRLIDFGIARGFSAGQKGTMIGTEGYSPPEQYRGEASPAGDLYSLGATLHHLLGKQDPRLEPPFSFGERPLRKLHPGVSAELDAIITKALSYNPADRYPSTQAMKEALLGLREARTTALGAGPGQPAATLGAPVARAGEAAPLWQFRCEDEVRGSACVANGALYIGAYDNNLYALSLADGRLLWKYATDGGLPGSPVIHHDLVLIGSEDHRLHAVSARSGRIQWAYYTDGPVRATPRVAEGHALVGSDDFYLHAVNLSTGRRAWRVMAAGAVRSRPAVSNESVFFGAESGDFYCVDFSGEERWRYRAKRAITSSPLLNNGVVYFGSHDGQVYAIEAVSGWTIWRFRTAKAVVASPALAGPLLLIGGADHNLYAIDTRTAREIWRFETGGQVTSSPAVAGDSVYFGSVDGMVYALEVTTGRLRWKFPSGGPITSSPVVDHDVVYIGSLDGHVYALAA